MNQNALSMAVVAAGSLGGGWVLRRPPSWRSILRYVAAASDESSAATDDTPHTLRRWAPEEDTDYYDTDANENVFLQTLGQQLVPAHLVFAAFGAGWAARGHATFARRILAAIAEAALHPGRAVRGGRRQANITASCAEEDDQDYAALIEELNAGGAAARQAAARRLGITEQDLCQRAKGGKPSQRASAK